MCNMMFASKWIDLTRFGYLNILILSVALWMPAQVSAETVRINFRDADIRSVIESVAEITDRTFVVDPRVKGKLTIISPTDIDAEMLYEVFLSAMQVHGFNAVVDGSVIRIVPAAQAYQLPGGNSGNELRTEVIPIENGLAAEYVPVLRPMLTQGAQLQAHQSSNHLVVTDTKSQLKRLKGVLARIDSDSNAAFDIVSLKHIGSGEILSILERFENFKGKRLTVVEDEFNNRLVVSGNAAARRQLKALVAQLDTPSSEEGGLEVIYLHYADAAETKKLLESMVSSKSFLRMAGEKVKDTKNLYKIEADSANNALVVAATPSVISALKSVVRKLDKPRLQVLIEAVLADVSRDKAMSIGVQLGVAYEEFGFLTNFDDLLPTLIDNNRGSSSDSSSDVSVPRGFVTGGANFDEETKEGIAGIIQALKTDGDTNIVSTPSLVTLDNEEAEISNGQEVPFITGNFTNSNSGGNNPFQTIEREEVGIKLTVKPQINEGDAIRLKIHHENSSVQQDANSKATDLITDKSTISTNVLVKDGQILVLGGLNDQAFRHSATKVPILGDIPLLGRLFRSSSFDNKDRVQMVFIKPTILRNSGEASDVSRQKYQTIRKKQIDFNEVVNDQAELPLLPVLEASSSTSDQTEAQ